MNQNETEELLSSNTKTLNELLTVCKELEAEVKEKDADIERLEAENKAIKEMLEGVIA